MFVPPQKDVFFHLTYEKIFIDLNIRIDQAASKRSFSDKEGAPEGYEKE